MGTLFLPREKGHQKQQPQRACPLWLLYCFCVLIMIGQHRTILSADTMLLPTTNVRPSIPEQGFWNQMLALLYQMDAADNLFPSIHCLNSWFCYIAVRSRREIPRWYQRFSFWAALAVFVSTLTTKQHVIADVIGGALLAEVTWQIAGRTHLGAWYGMILERRRWKRRAE